MERHDVEKVRGKCIDGINIMRQYLDDAERRISQNDIHPEEIITTTQHGFAWGNSNGISCVIDAITLLQRCREKAEYVAEHVVDNESKDRQRAAFDAALKTLSQACSEDHPLSNDEIDEIVETIESSIKCGVLTHVETANCLSMLRQSRLKAVIQEVQDGA